MSTNTSIMNSMLKLNSAYIQKNPLFGRKVILVERIRPSVWDWDLCDISVVTIDKEPVIRQIKSVASSIYDHQGLEEIPQKVFHKIETLVKLLNATAGIVDEQQFIVMRQETMGKIIEILLANNIIDDTTYNAAQMKTFAEQYDQYSRQQMQHVTDVIDVHK